MPKCSLTHQKAEQRDFRHAVLSKPYKPVLCAATLGYDVIVIFGSPANYVARGFKSCKKFNVCADNGRYPAAMLVKELVPGALDGRKWVYRDSPVMAFSEEEAQRYDDTLEKLEKKWQPSQEEFYILSHSFVE